MELPRLVRKSIATAGMLGAAAFWRIQQVRLQIVPWSQFLIPDQARSIAIVGNAGYLTDLEQGRLIDDYDLVIRMNNCRVRGFEPYVGSRTSIYFTSFWRDIDWTNPVINDADWVCSSRPNNFLPRLSGGMHLRNGVFITRGMIKAHRRMVFVPDFPFFRDLTMQLGGLPTTGAMACLFALGLLAQAPLSIYITGFSFFEGRHYYFQNDLTSPPCHALENERALLRHKLVSGMSHGQIRCDPVMKAYLTRANSGVPMEL